MALREVGSIVLPPNTRTGGFDHAAVHRRSGLVHVAQTCDGKALVTLDAPTGKVLHRALVFVDEA